jgi:SAM-dependent methyltransferase
MRPVGSAEYRARQFLVKHAAPLGFRLVSSAANVAKTRVRRSLAVENHARGAGLEVGAGASPAIVPRGARVTYVDKYPIEFLRSDPELSRFNFAAPDIVAPAETLAPIADDSQDFVLAFSLLEHVQDPLGTLRAFCRVTRPGGTLILSVPDRRRYGPDKPRSVTPFEHFERDYREGPAVSVRDHFTEVGKTWHSLSGVELDEFVESSVKGDSHCHFHVWESETFVRFLLDARRVIEADYELIEMAAYGVETLAVLAVR